MAPVETVGLFYALVGKIRSMDQNPYESPRHCVERPRQPRRATSTATKVAAAMIAIAGIGQLTEGIRREERWRIGGGLVLLTVVVALRVAGDRPFFGQVQNIGRTFGRG